MSIDQKVTAAEIVVAAGMSRRPEYYSGRGAIESDLNDTILEKVYQGIHSAHGKDAADQFVCMVVDMPRLTATDFLLTLYSLEAAGWTWDKKYLGKEHGIDVGPDRGDGAREAIGMATIFEVLSGHSQRDETARIRGEFLRRHGIQESEPARKLHGYRHDFY
ncbi:hypothetical protein J4464_02410 [Candidatus Woesearchaeota archaeon]|nr:hypothetical protein [Candidatus Woesearchaeota archaeon]